ncbi:hypothetical protein CTEN210_08796 [Chaetoceros tenuissimus]|uniref:MYND-type domain-containing protein n=1 Tax=Chaetoceros tenuissimus TaxID=426638 RepID=A0AAD3CWM4_9STRA|nr:hypothetical protein CTEN210_08796 [Chaetoceros tenuissimus]
MPLKTKLRGAAARLFAEICEEYINIAEELESCRDAPDDVPLFSYLSPQQRLSLVKDVMIGALCQDEPMFPDTIQHNAAYLGIIHVLYSHIEAEVDCEDGLVEEDFLEEGQRQARLLGSFSGFRSSRTSSTHDSMFDFTEERELMEYRAEKNHKKLQERGDNVGEFKPESVNRNSFEDQMELFKKMEDLCVGGPISKKDRDNIRPFDDELDEKYAYRWRLLCDAALQEDTAGTPFPLSDVNFDFRCSSAYKWNEALNFLFVDRCLQISDPKERALVHCGEINQFTYANPDKFPLIREINRHVDILRKVYEKKWNPDRRSFDQRCIFALTSSEIYCGPANHDWVVAFFKKCLKQNVDISKDSNNYQKRLQLFREIAEELPEGLKIPFTCYPSEVQEKLEKWQPSKFVSEAYNPNDHWCSGPGDGHGFMAMPCTKKDNLRACTRCKVVLYCSRECQTRHWKHHKLVCKRIADTRKDKDQIAEMARNNENIANIRF